MNSKDYFEKQVDAHFKKMEFRNCRADLQVGTGRLDRGSNKSRTKYLLDLPWVSWQEEFYVLNQYDYIISIPFEGNHRRPSSANKSKMQHNFLFPGRFQFLLPEEAQPQEQTLLLSVLYVSL